MHPAIRLSVDCAHDENARKAELQSEERWARAFAGSQDELAKLAQETLAEYHAS